MKYKVTAKIIHIVEALYAEGFSGEIKLDNSYATGTKGVLGDAVSVIIPGFCKESLHLVEDVETGHVVGVGRYALEFTEYEIDVKFLVSNAWRNYKSYKESGYSRPYQFEKLFYKYGYLKDEIITQKVVKEL